MNRTHYDKVERILDIYIRMRSGDLINKFTEAQNYGVNERTIQRDIADMRNYFEISNEITGIINTIVYDRIKKAYRLKEIYKEKLTNSEILSICKILLDSRAFRKNMIESIIDRLISGCVPKEHKVIVKKLIASEENYYIELRHNIKSRDDNYIQNMWDIGQAIHNNQYIKIDYSRTKDKKIVTRKLKPLAIIFSEYYFYVTAFIDDEVTRSGFEILNDSFPTIYRIDRIKKLVVLEEKFYIPYTKEFKAGEFRKRVQFMYGGRLQKIKFKYTGPDVDAVRDRLPTAKIVSEEGECYVIEAEVFGKGIDMWIRSQGDYIELL